MVLSKNEITPVCVLYQAIELRRFPQRIFPEVLASQGQSHVEFYPQGFSTWQAMHEVVASPKKGWDILHDGSPSPLSFNIRINNNNNNNDDNNNNNKNKNKNKNKQREDTALKFCLLSKIKVSCRSDYSTCLVHHLNHQTPVVLQVPAPNFPIKSQSGWKRRNKKGQDIPDFPKGENHIRGFLSAIGAHTMQVWYSHLRMDNSYGECRWIYHTWMLWGESSADLVLSNVYNFFLNRCHRLIHEHSRWTNITQIHLSTTKNTSLRITTFHPGALRSLRLLCLFHGKKRHNKNTSKQDRLSQTIPSPQNLSSSSQPKKDKNTQKKRRYGCFQK